MSIANKLNQILETKEAIADAIEAQGITMEDRSLFSSYPAEIAKLGEENADSKILEACKEADLYTLDLDGETHCSLIARIGTGVNISEMCPVPFLGDYRQDFNDSSLSSIPIIEPGKINSFYISNNPSSPSLRIQPDITFPATSTNKIESASAYSSYKYFTDTQGFIYKKASYESTYSVFVNSTGWSNVLAGSSYIFAIKDNGLYKINGSGSAQTLLYQGTNITFGPVWVYSSSRMALIDDGVMKVINSSSENVVTVDEIPALSSSDKIFYNGSGFIVGINQGENKGRVYIVDIEYSSVDVTIHDENLGSSIIKIAGNCVQFDSGIYKYAMGSPSYSPALMDSKVSGNILGMYGNETTCIVTDNYLYFTDSSTATSLRVIPKRFPEGFVLTDVFMVYDSYTAMIKGTITSNPVYRIPAYPSAGSEIYLENELDASVVASDTAFSKVSSISGDVCNVLPTYGYSTYTQLTKIGASTEQFTSVPPSNSRVVALANAVT